MELTVRADGNGEIGYGHLLRTLTVARALRDRRTCAVRYLMRSESDERPVSRAGFAVDRLTHGDGAELVSVVRPADGPLLVDSYLFAEGDLDLLHQHGFCLLVFDDGCRLVRYAADVVVDYAPGAGELSYSGLETTRFCLGPAWFPLRSEFIDVDGDMRRAGPVKSLLVTFGGSDPDDQTASVLEILRQDRRAWGVTVLLGPGYRGRAADVVAGDARFALVRDVENVAPLFVAADVAISGAGGTCLELAALGVPMVLFVLSQDQRRIAYCMERAGAAVNLGEPEETDADKLKTALNSLVDAPERRQRMSAAGRGLVDGLGAERIARVIDCAWSARFPQRANGMSA